MQHPITHLLQQVQDDPSGSDEARDRLFTAVYQELRGMAAGLMRGERAGHTLRPTALVNEAYVKLVESNGGKPWENRAHFFGIAARAMRQILVDHARARDAAKRGGGLRRVTLDEPLVGNAGPDLDVLALHDALERLAGMDERMSQVVELRAFGGLTMEEIAEALGVSRRTVFGDWGVARKWLSRELA